MMNSLLMRGKNLSLNFLKTSNKRMSNMLFTRQFNSETIKSGTSVVVYEGPEWKEIDKYLNENNYYSVVPKDNQSINTMYDIWTNCVFNTSFKAKYFSLLPFFFEDRQSVRAKKKFVLKMELYPETKQLKFTFALPSGIAERIEPLADIVPLTPGDFRTRHLVLRSRPPHFVDMDMVYGNRKIIDMYCFDKLGSWVKEGVDHPLLKLENSYKEQNWFDHLNWYTWY